MFNIPKLIIIVGIILALATPVMGNPGVNWTTDSFNGNITAPTIDVVNSTYLQGWLYYLMITNITSPWEFPIIGFSGSTMQPFLDAFEGGTGTHGIGAMVYLILWGLFIMLLWRQSGKITIPAMMAVITAGAWGLLFPESAQPWIQILLCAAIASQLFSFFAKE